MEEFDFVSKPTSSVRKRPRIYVSQGNDVSSRAACNYGRGARYLTFIMVVRLRLVRNLLSEFRELSIKSLAI